MSPLEWDHSLLSIVTMTIAAGVVLVLPGLSVATRIGRTSRSPLDAALLGIGIWVVGLAAIGTVLAGVGWFRPWFLIVIALLVAGSGLRRLGPMFRSLLPLLPGVVVGAIAAVPAGMAAAGAGLTPAHTFQWYYANLGRDLVELGGIPEQVLEYGQQVRWLPDYISFHVVAESSVAAAVGLERITAVQAAHYVVALAGIIALYLVFRLWLAQPAAVVGTGLLMTTGMATQKFSDLRPEAIALSLALLSTRLTITGIRRRSPLEVIVGCSLMASAFSAHAIAAVAIGTWWAAAVVVELIRLDDTRTRASLLVPGVAVAALLVVGTGLVAQGRAIVLTDASRPVLAADGSDASWTYIERSEGRFEVREPPARNDLHTFVGTPWRGVDLGDKASWWIWTALVVGSFLVLVRGSPGERGLLAIAVIAAAILFLGISYFVFSYDTFVPRNTGQSRLAQYVPLALSLVATVTASVVLDLDRRMNVVGKVVVVSAVLFLAVPVINSAFESGGRLDEEHRVALATLADLAEPGDVVYSNVTTRGVIEALVAVEVPLEGRQPFIEDPALLASANDLLLDFNQYLAAAAPPPVDAEWVLVSRNPRGLGRAPTYGDPDLEAAVLENSTIVFESENVSILRIGNEAVATQQSDRTVRRLLAALIWSALLAAVATIVWRIGDRG